MPVASPFNPSPFQNNCGRFGFASPSFPGLSKITPHRFPPATESQFPLHGGFSPPVWNQVPWTGEESLTGYPKQFTSNEAEFDVYFWVTTFHANHGDAKNEEKCFISTTDDSILKSNDLLVVSQEAIAESEDHSTRKGQKKRFMKKGSVSLGHTDIILSIFFNQRPSGKLPFHPMLKNRIPISWAISQNPYKISSDTQSPEEKLLEPKIWCFGRWFFSKSKGSSSSLAAYFLHCSWYPNSEFSRLLQHSPTPQQCGSGDLSIWAETYAACVGEKSLHNWMMTTTTVTGCCANVFFPKLPSLSVWYFCLKNHSFSNWLTWGFWLYWTCSLWSHLHPGHGGIWEIFL